MLNAPTTHFTHRYCSLYALKDESYLRQHLEKQHTTLHQATISYTVRSKIKELHARWFSCMLELSNEYQSFSLIVPGTRVYLTLWLMIIQILQNLSLFTHPALSGLGGSHTSILTPYLKSTGLFTPGVKFSSNSVQLLQRYYNIQAHSNVGMENLNLGNPSNLMT